MTYTKPELVALSHAVEAIQSGGKGGKEDDGPPDTDHSIPAYEADE